jgi:hypothetical protein
MSGGAFLCESPARCATKGVGSVHPPSGAAAKNKCLADRNKRSTSAKPTDAAVGLLISFASGHNLCEGPSGASPLPPPRDRWCGIFARGRERLPGGLPADICCCNSVASAAVHPSEGCRRLGGLPGRGRATVRVPASGNGFHRRFARSLKAMPRMAAVTTKRKTDRPEPRLVAATEEFDAPNNFGVCDHLVLVMCS